MHPRRLLPHRLSLALGLVLLASACASPRYIGSIGRNQVYSNRGFGLLVDLSKGGVSARWTALDPGDLESVPPASRPQRVREPLDLDGDGFLQVTETTIYYDPTLRLLSRTSSVAKMDLTVQILGKNNAAVPLDAIVGLDIKARTETSSAARSAAFARIQRRTLTGEIQARILEVAPPGGGEQVRWLVADVPDFVAEEGQKRRHIVRLTLTAPKLDAQLRADFDAVVSGLLLAPKGARPGTQEQW